MARDAGATFRHNLNDYIEFSFFRWRGEDSDALVATAHLFGYHDEEEYFDALNAGDIERRIKDGYLDEQIAALEGETHE